MRSAGRGMPTRPSTSTARSSATAFDAPRCSRTDSAIWSPIVIVGFSEVSGSWKIIPIWLPRTCSISDSGSAATSVPSTTMRPPTTSPPDGSSRMMDSAVIVLPLPDSPTMPRHSPGSTVSDTPSMACTVARRSLISMRRSSMIRSGANGKTSSQVENSAPLQADLERVTQRVTDEVDRDDDEDDRDAGREDLPPVAVVDRVDAGVEHAAPVGLRRTDAEAQVGPRHDQQDRVGDLEGGVDDDRADRVRRDVPEHRPHRPAAHHLHRLHVVAHP